MRIVTKINTALGALITLSVLLNWGALEFTVKPSFLELEEKTARDNHGRVLEAIGRLQAQTRGSARDYAVWDDTFAFMNGELPDYMETNVNAEALRALNANFFAIVDNSGKLFANAGYLFSGEEPVEAHLIAPAQAAIDSSLLRAISGSEPAAGLLATRYGPAAVGFARILKSDASVNRRWCRSRRHGGPQGRPVAAGPPRCQPGPRSSARAKAEGLRAATSRS